MAKSRKRLLAVGALIGICTAVAGIAYAAIPSNGVITGCYLKSGGTLRVIDATTSNCSSKETRLDWNVQGAEGPAGPPGATGPAGPAGMSGHEIVRASREHTEDTANSTRAVAVTATCPQGKRVVGGGGGGSLSVGNAVVNLLQIVSSTPSEFGGTYSWSAALGKGDGSYFAPGETAITEVYAICVNVDG